MPLISAANVGYTYPTLPGASPALSSVSFAIERGEWVALLGANGSGKTTLALLLDGLLTPSSGSVTVDERDTRREADLPWIRRRVALVFQRPEEQIVGVTVEEDTAFGPENVGMALPAMREAVEQALRTVGLWELRDRSPHELSAGQKQRLAIAGALALAPECLVLDEASSMLDPRGRRELLDMLARLNASGITIVQISHKMEESAHAARALVLHRGRLVADEAPSTLFERSELAEWGLRPPAALTLARELRTRFALPIGSPLTFDALARELAGAARSAREDDASTVPAAAPGTPSAAPAFAATNGVRASAGGEPFARIDRLDHAYGDRAARSLNAISISIRRGEAVALVGATGSGKSTLLQHLNALYLPQSGSVELFGTSIGPRLADLPAVRRRAALVFQRPEEQLFERYVGDEVAYGPRLAGLQGKALSARVRGAMEGVGLDFAAYKDRLTFALSGGEQRKVGLADALALEPVALLLDEPTAGLDPEAREETLALIERMHERGVTIVMATHDMEEVARITERTIALASGRVAFDGPTRAFFEQGHALRGLGLDVPGWIALLIELADSGIEVPRVAISLEESAELLGPALARARRDGRRHAAV